MDLEGRFTNADSLADVIRQLGRETMSGTLTVQSTGLTVQLYFLRGMLTGTDNQQRPRRLGHILLGRGLVDRAALEEALAYQHDFAPGTPLGKVLVFRERITSDDLRDALRLQLEEEIWDLLMNQEGTYRFMMKDPAGADPPLVEMDPLPLVDEVISRRVEWAQLKSRISSDSMIPAVVKIQNSADREMLNFSKREWQILSLVNGYYDVGCIATRSGLGRFESYRVLNTFLSSGVVELRNPSEPVPAEFGEEGQPSPSTTTSNSASGSSASRWSGILARIRDSEQDEPETPAIEKGRLHFESPVSFAVAMANAVISRLMANQDFVVDPNDERLAERYWRQVLMSCPRADLVTASMNTLEAASFDRYIRTLGVQGPMKSIYLETMDGLSRFLRTLYLLASQRLGVKVAKTLFVTVMDDVRQRASMDKSEIFFFKEFASKVLE